MGLIEEFVTINITSRNVGHYRKLGYNLANKNYPYFYKVNSKDVPRTSSVKVQVQCDYCGEIFTTTKRLYNVMIKAKTSKCACKKCQGKKVKDTIKTEYGVNNYMEVPEFVTKMKQTNLEQYGAENPFGSKEIQSKIRKTIKEKYGVEFSGQIEEGKQKAIQTSLERYGTKHPTQSQAVQDKKRETVHEKYGVNCVSQLEEVKEKTIKTMQKRYGVNHYRELLEERKKASEYFLQNNVAASSKTQDTLCEWFNGKLNYFCHGFFLDILYENWLDIEYNGTGHDLQVRFGNISKEEFNKKESKRKAAIIGYGYKMLILIRSNPSKRDELPDKNSLMKNLMNCIETLRTTKQKIMYYDIDKATIIT